MEHEVLEVELEVETAREAALALEAVIARAMAEVPVVALVAEQVIHSETEKQYRNLPQNTLVMKQEK